MAKVNRYSFVYFLKKYKYESLNMYFVLGVLCCADIPQSTKTGSLTQAMKGDCGI